MKIFITGGSGFVGGAFIKANAKTHEIFAMSRSEASDEKLNTLGAKPIRCSLNNIKATDLQGCKTIIHCAAYVEEWGNWTDYEQINIEGTRQILGIAKRAGVKRFIHMSTEATLFHGQHMRKIDETYPLALRSPFPYSRTKAQAEKLVKEANDNADKFTTISLRPRMIWGPDDQTILPIIRDMARSGKFTWIDGGRVMTSTTHIANLVSAMGLALTHGTGGEAYFILDEDDIKIRDFLSQYLATAGVDLGNKS
ncbi:MAG: NAD-dependent epimerase/dehydratase family protein, partial [Robiginitomaculum sp.]|nr:NAD-dependent epimerase/dehydratase family protein [Robiginitomaculum sp.]